MLRFVLGHPKTKNPTLKVQPSKLDKNMITSTQIANTKTFACIAVLVFKLLSRKFSFIN